jgi:hypothetical protein
MSKNVFILAVIFILLCITQLPAFIIHVPADFATIQLAIDGTMDGDTVMVAPGSYIENRIDFSGKAITVMGSDPDDPLVVENTVVDGDTAWGPIFYFRSGEDSTSVLTGLKIVGAAGTEGGGVQCYLSSPIITKNIISMNLASESGGGIHCEYASPMISHNLITSNYSGTGGGIFCSGSSYPIIVNNTIGGNVANQGGGIYCSNGTSVLVYNTILWGNSASEGPQLWAGTTSYPCTLDISFADVEGGLADVHVEQYSVLEWGPGMIDTDPLFVDMGNENYRLHTDSPSIDSGDPSSSTPPNGGDRIDMGALEYQYPDEPPLILTFGNTPQFGNPGERVSWNYAIENPGDEDVTFDGWIAVSGPYNAIRDSVLDVRIPAHATFRGIVWMNVPVNTPLGSYVAKGRLGTIHEEIWDGEVFDAEIVEDTRTFEKRWE